MKNEVKERENSHANAWINTTHFSCLLSMLNRLFQHLPKVHVTLKDCRYTTTPKRLVPFQFFLFPFKPFVFLFSPSCYLIVEGVESFSASTERLASVAAVGPGRGRTDGKLEHRSLSVETKYDTAWSMSKVVLSLVSSKHTFIRWHLKCDTMHLSEISGQRLEKFRQEQSTQHNFVRGRIITDKSVNIYLRLYIVRR